MNNLEQPLIEDDFTFPVTFFYCEGNDCWVELDEYISALELVEYATNGEIGEYEARFKVIMMTREQYDAIEDI